MVASSSGFVVEGAGVMPDGRPFSFLWKAWLSLPPVALKWEVKRVLPAVGFKESSQNTKVCDTIANESSFPAWSRTWARFGHRPEDMFGRSRRSLQARVAPEEALQDADQEFWFSTPGLLFTLLHWARFRKFTEDKARAMSVFKQFLRQCVDVDKLVATRPLQLDPAHRSLCRDPPIVEDTCKCVARASRLVMREGGEPQSRVAELLAALFREDGCAASRQWADTLVQHIAGIIDDSVEAWGNPRLREIAGLSMAGPSGKRRRTDPHVAELVVSAVEESQSGAPLASAAPAHMSEAALRSAVLRDMCWRQAAAHMLGGKAVVVSGCFDAVRLGKPAQELLIHQLWDHRTNTSVMLPPAV